MQRLPGGVLAALVLLILAVAPVTAGGWASITPDDASAAAEPVAGEPVELGFTVLQHGETPAAWVSATVILVNAATGERITSQATSTGQDGHFVATVTPTDAGLWTWSVELAELATDPAAVPLGVRTAGGVLPPIDGATAVRLVEQAKADVRAELRGEYANRLESLQRAVDMADTQATAIGRRLAAETEARAALQERVDGLGGVAPAAPGAMLLLAVACVAVLASAVTSFAMLRLARPGPITAPAPAGDPPQPGLAPSR